MPSPIVPVSNTQPSSRHPRRKRHDSEEGATLRQQPQRKRSKLNNDLTGSLANSHTVSDALETVANGHSLHGLGDHSSVALKNIPYRGQSRPRSSQKHDEATVTLAKNDRYSIKQLPSLPPQIDQGNIKNFRGAHVGRNGYALALTQEQAIIWNYAVPASAPSTKVFTINHPARGEEPLPFGALVATGVSAETGLVVVNATNGKIQYWENIENADALNLFERRHNGAEGSCGSLLSGEIVINIEEIGSAGFILSFSSGRTAQLLLRDGQSRPSVNVQFLRGNSTSAGFFGGLRNVFGGGHLKVIAAVRHRPLRFRDHEEAVVVNEDALIQYWHLAWSSQPSISTELNAFTVIEAAVNSLLTLEAPLQALKVMDFVISSDLAEESNLLFLVNYTTKRASEYALIEIDVDSEGAHSRRVIRLHSYTNTISTDSRWKPTLCLPQPNHAAMVFFEKAITIVSLQTTLPLPEAQLLMDSGQLPEPFQDTVYFRDGSDFVICGISSEAAASQRQHRPSSAIAFVNDFGIIRITAEYPEHGDESYNDLGPSAKTKIEQAVFFGSIANSPLNLTRKGEQLFSVEEIEEAALQISHEILATESSYVVPAVASMAEHLDSRAKHLNALAVHVLSLSSEISRSTRWKLRCDAEKLAAAIKIWSMYDGLLQLRWREMRTLTETLVIMNEDQKTEIDRPNGQYDQARLWFTKDIWRMQNVFEWVFKALEVLKSDEMVRDDDKYLELIGEGHDILNEGLDAAFRFREESASVYGLGQEHLQNGLLEGHDAYANVPELWTSTMRTLIQCREHFYRIRNPLNQILKGVDDAERVPDIVRKLVDDCARLVDTFCRSFEENIRWNASQPGEEERRNAVEYQVFYEDSRKTMIINLIGIDIEMTDQATEIAEKYRDMPALVELVSTESANILRSLKNHQTLQDREYAESLEREMAARIKRYFKIFGQEWGEAMYSKNIQNCVLSTILNTAKDHGGELTRFLRANPSRAKLSWINDVISERDYTKAAESLRLVAREQEDKLWSKKVQLSIAKLALLSAENGSKLKTGPQAKEMSESQVVGIQEKIYEHVRPFLYDAVDQAAEIQLAMETFGTRTTKRTPALASLLEQGLKGIVEHDAVSIEQLIDVLTLMDRRQCSMKENDISNSQTYLALLALKYAGLEKDRKQFELLLRLIWKRCFISDDWKTVNDTSKKDDQGALADLESTVLFKTLLRGYEEDLWEVSSGIRLLTADDCVGAGTQVEDYDFRFSNRDISSGIAKDVRHEDAILQRYADQYRLENWLVATKEAAERRFHEEEESRKGMTKKVGTMVEDIRAERPKV